MKIVKAENRFYVGDFLEENLRRHPYLKYRVDCDELGCSHFIRERKWFGKDVCSFHHETVEVYIEKYKNDIIDIVRTWERVSGNDVRVIVP